MAAAQSGKRAAAAGSHDGSQRGLRGLIQRRKYQQVISQGLYQLSSAQQPPVHALHAIYPATVINRDSVAAQLVADAVGLPEVLVDPCLFTVNEQPCKSKDMERMCTRDGERG